MTSVIVVQRTTQSWPSDECFGLISPIRVDAAQAAGQTELPAKQRAGFRSPEGADRFCRIRGYLSTLRKQGYSVLEGLTSVFNGRPLLPRLQA